MKGGSEERKKKKTRPKEEPAARAVPPHKRPRSLRHSPNSAPAGQRPNGRLSKPRGIRAEFLQRYAIVPVHGCPRLTSGPGTPGEARAGARPIPQARLDPRPAEQHAHPIRPLTSTPSGAPLGHAQPRPSVSVPSKFAYHLPADCKGRPTSKQATDHASTNTSGYPLASVCPSRGADAEWGPRTTGPVRGTGMRRLTALPPSHFMPSAQLPPLYLLQLSPYESSRISGSQVSPGHADTCRNGA